MPIYEYKCDKCGEKFEELWRSWEEAGKFVDGCKCPKCGQMARRLPPTGVHAWWVGRILEWGKPDRTVSREEDLIEYEGQRSKEDSANVGRKFK